MVPKIPSCHYILLMQPSLLKFISNKLNIFYFRCRTAGQKSVFGRSCDRPPRHGFFLVSLCLKANAEMVPKIPNCHYMLLMQPSRLKFISNNLIFFTLDVGLLARSQYPEGPATGLLDTSFSWFPCACMQMLRWLPLHASHVALQT